MKVSLIKEAEYEFDVDSCTKVQLDTFMKMAAIKYESGCDPTLPKVTVFNTIEDFKNYQFKSNFDGDNVFIAQSGKIFVFLKNQTLTCDESTNTKEDKGKET